MAPNTPTSVMLVTGEYFDHLAPDPSVITLDVLEHGLAAPRFNNQTTRPITVLEHSLRVRRIARELAFVPEVVAATRREYLKSVEIWALLHDAHEAIVPWGDCLRPGKTDAMREVEAEVDAAIRCALVVSLPTPAVFDIVKTADSIALYFEAMLWQPGARDWAPGLLHPIWADEHGQVGNSGLTKVSLVERFMPLIAPRPGECWRTEVEALLGGRDV